MVTKSQNQNIVMGLDIGGSKICVAICEIDRDNGLNLKGVGTGVTSGLSKGKVVDKEALQSAIDRVIKRAERQSGHCTNQVITSVPYDGMTFIKNTGSVVSDEDSGQISQSDWEESIRKSKQIKRSSLQKILHVIPLKVTVDDQIVKNPVGVFGSKIEVLTHIVLGNIDTILSVSQTLKMSALQVKGIIYDVLASTQVYLTEKERRQGHILIDMGGQQTKVSLMKDDLLKQSFVVPIGGETLTADIATCLNIAVPEAERLKIIYGDVTLSAIAPDDMIDVTTKTDNKSTIKRYYLCQILEARVKEWCHLIQSELAGKGLEKYNIVIGGGGGLLSGLLGYMKQSFSVDIREGLPEDLRSVVESASYATAVGIVMYGIKSKAICYVSVGGDRLGIKLKKWIEKML